MVFSFRNRKARGTAGERDLVHLFWAAGWAAFRAAGSGSVKYAVPDLIAGHGSRKLAIEAKITSDDVKYLTRKEVEELQQFCARFGGEAWVAVKFPKMEWRFFSAEDLRWTEASVVVRKQDAEGRGLSFEELVR